MALIKINNRSSEDNAVHGRRNIFINSGFLVSQRGDYTSATAITNREYEESEQDKKRKIRLLDPNFVDKFVDEFKVLMKESII